MTTKRGIATILTCHCVYDVTTNTIHAEHPMDRPVYEAQLVYASKHVAWRSPAQQLLIITGGKTKAALALSESRSHLGLADAIGCTLPERTALEESALISPENLLLSLYTHHQVTGAYPEQIDVISWAFKRERFEATLNAINDWSPLSWPSLNFFPVGDLWGNAKEHALRTEAEYLKALKGGLAAYYANPIVQGRIAERDVHESRKHARVHYRQYPLPF